MEADDKKHTVPDTPEPGHIESDDQAPITRTGEITKCIVSIMPNIKYKELVRLVNERRVLTQLRLEGPMTRATLN